MLPHIIQNVQINTARHTLTQQFLTTSIHVLNMTVAENDETKAVLTTTSFVAKPAAVSERYSLSILTHRDGSLWIKMSPEHQRMTQLSYGDLPADETPILWLANWLEVRPTALAMTLTFTYNLDLQCPASHGHGLLTCRRSRSKINWFTSDNGYKRMDRRTDGQRWLHYLTC